MVTDALGNPTSGSALVDVGPPQNYGQEVGQPCVQSPPAPLTPIPTTPFQETLPSGAIAYVPGQYYDRCDEVYVNAQGQRLPLGPKGP